MACPDTCANIGILFFIIQTHIYIGKSHVKSLPFPNLDIRNWVLKLKFDLSDLNISECCECKNTAAHTPWTLALLESKKKTTTKKTKKKYHQTHTYFIFSKIKEYP